MKFFCMGAIMRIILNGQDVNISEGTSLVTLLEWEGLEPAVVVVELNGKILPAKDFENTILNDSDTLEVLQFVGGG